MRDGWLGQLAAGHSHIVVTGDGDGQIGDVVHLDAPDDYEGLPQKVLAAIDWVQTTDTGHMLKVDDIVNVDAFLGDPATPRSNSRTPAVALTGRMDRAGMAKSGSSGAATNSTAARTRSMPMAAPATRQPPRHGRGAQGRGSAGPAPDRGQLHGGQADRRPAASGRGRTPRTAIRHVRRRTIRRDSVPIWVNDVTRRPSWSISTRLRGRNRAIPPELARTAAQEDLAQLHGFEARLSQPRAGNGHAPRPGGPVARGPVAVVAVARNEMFMAPRFWTITANWASGFAIADNLSDDGTLEYLAEQPDVTLFSVDTEYRLSRYGMAWQQAMLSAFRVGRWSLVADADELLVWQAKQSQSLPDLLQTPDFAGADAARVLMLDMYPRGSLSDADFIHADPFAQTGFCDARPFLPGAPGAVLERPHLDQRLRHRLIPARARSCRPRNTRSCAIIRSCNYPTDCIISAARGASRITSFCSAISSTMPISAEALAEVAASTMPRNIAAIWR